MSLVFGAFNMLWIVFMMTLVEIALNENKILGVLGAQGTVSTATLLQPGQLLPMLIGTFSFIRVLFIAYELYRYPDGDISPSLGRQSSKREAEVRQDAANYSNVFKLFSAANEVRKEELHHLAAKENKDLEEQETDPFCNLHKRLTPFQKVMVTWLPWLSLLFFWPWTEDRGSTLSQNEDHASTTLLSNSRRTRNSDFEMEMASTQTGYNRVSRTSLDEESAQQPQRIV